MSQQPFQPSEQPFQPSEFKPTFEPQGVPTYNLALDKTHAEVLAVILAKVGGDHRGPRGAAENIAKALRAQGFIWDQVPWASNGYGNLDGKVVDGSINFPYTA